MGTPDFAREALAKIIAEHDVVCVYSQPPRPAGRGKKERPSAVHAFAESKGIEVRTPVSLKNDDEQAAFAALKADVAVVAAYGLILPKAILDAPRLGCVNIHASLLPRWRGAAPIQRAIMAGDEKTGVTIMQMEEGLDTGPELCKTITPIGPDTTAGTLHDTLADIGGDLIVETLSHLESLTPQPQPEEGVTYASKIDKAEARIDWSHSAIDVARHINGLSPFPGAWFEAAGQRIKALQAQVVDGKADAGTVLDGLTIACGEGAVHLPTVQRAGKGPMDAKTFLLGFDLGQAVT